MDRETSINLYKDHVSPGKVAFYNQYDIVLVDLTLADSRRSAGAEMNKVKPCVVISPDEMNRHLRTVVVIPMTTSPKIMPTRIRVRHNQRTGWIVVDQIRTVDRSRIKRKLGRITNPEIRQLKQMIQRTYVD